MSRINMSMILPYRLSRALKDERGNIPPVIPPAWILIDPAARIWGFSRGFGA